MKTTKKIVLGIAITIGLMLWLVLDGASGAKDRQLSRRKWNDAEVAAQAERAASSREERGIGSLSVIERNCLTLYERYDDVSVKDLTMRQTQLIRTCQSLGMYHDFGEGR